MTSSQKQKHKLLKHRTTSLNSLGKTLATKQQRGETFLPPPLSTATLLVLPFFFFFFLHLMSSDFVARTCGFNCSASLLHNCMLTVFFYEYLCTSMNYVVTLQILLVAGLLLKPAQRKHISLTWCYGQTLIQVATWSASFAEIFCVNFFCRFFTEKCQTLWRKSLHDECSFKGLTL